MPIKNTDDRYGIITILFHWIMALIMIFLTLQGLYMVDMRISLKKLNYFTLHKELGMVVLALGVVRFIWRLSNTTPDLGKIIPVWQAFLARCAHWTFYLLMFGLPISGWYIISAAGVPLSLFGWFLIPNLMEKSRDWIPVFTTIHAYLSYTLIMMIGIHSFAALLHHFYYQDDVLKRIVK